MDRTHVNLKLDRSGEGRLKATWSDASTNLSYPPYHLVTCSFKEKIAAARTALEGLGQAYLQPKPDYETAIAELARCGYELRQALFESCQPEDTTSANEAHDWFNNAIQGPAIVTVNADPILPIPWGILHERVSEGAGDPYNDFWALRFEVAALYKGMRPLPGRRAPGGVKLIAGLNEEVFERTRRLCDPEQLALINTLLNHPVGRALTIRGLQDRWQQVGNSDCLIYFFGHATGNEVHFSAATDGRLSADRFRSLFRRESPVERHQTQVLQVLTVLNGCASVTGRDSEGFMLATAAPGFCGFVGAEAKVPDHFGLLFGHELLQSLLEEGRTVRDSMVMLWRKHRPLGLLYGCYAQPAFAISPRKTANSITRD